MVMLIVMVIVMESRRTKSRRIELENEKHCDKVLIKSSSTEYFIASSKRQLQFEDGEFMKIRKIYIRLYIFICIILYVCIVLYSKY